MSDLKRHLKRTGKAYMGGAIAVLSFLAPAVDDGLAVSEAIGAGLAGLVAWQGIYWTGFAGGRVDTRGGAAD